MINSSKGLGCILCSPRFGQTLNFYEEKLFVFRYFLDKIGNARKSLGVIFGFQGFTVFIEVGNVVLHLLDLIGGCLGLFD